MILGHGRQIKYLEKVFKNGRVAHAHLFYGPEHVGKFTVARHFADLFSKKEVMVLEPNSIDDIRELKRRFSYAAREGEWRITIINYAERMSLDAANAFLKLLEEPGERTLFILITPAKDLVLPTIFSRAQPLRFSTVPDSVLEEFLKPKTKDAKERREFLAYVAGRPGLMKTFLEDKTAWESEKKFVRSLASSIRGGAPEIFRFTGKVSQDENLRLKTVEYATRILRKSLINKPSLKIAKRVKKMDEIATLLETTNVNPRLALDVLLLEAVQ